MASLTNGGGKTSFDKGAYQPDDSDNEIYSDSDVETDSDSDFDRPPEKISIERSTDLESLKLAFTNMGGQNDVNNNNSMNGPSEISLELKKQRDEELEQLRTERSSNLNQLANAFERMGGMPKMAGDYDQSSSVGGADNDLSLSKNQRPIEIDHSESDKKRLQMLFQKGDPVANHTTDQLDVVEHCAVCGAVGNRATIRLGGSWMKLRKGGLLHRNCFRCAECRRGLSPNLYYNLDGKFYCKLHALKKQYPNQQELTMDMVESMQLSIENGPPDEELSLEEDEAYAVVSQPKSLDPKVVRSESKVEDEILSGFGLTAINEKKKAFSPHPESQNGTGGNVAFRKSFDNDPSIECQMIRPGQVKDRMSKFGDGRNANVPADGDENAEDEEDYKNANVPRSAYKKREELKLDIDSKSIKSKFESGGPQTESQISPLNAELMAAELQALKNSSGMSQAKEKYISGCGDDDSRKKSTTTSIIDEITPMTAASIQEAKDKFIKGETAFRESMTSAEKFREPIPFTELTSVKERFENPQSARKRLDDRSLSPTLISGPKCHELNSLKASFEAGGKKKYSEDELEARRKRHLELEFKRLQVEKGIFNEKQRKEAEEEAKKQKALTSELEDIKTCPELGALKERFERQSVQLDDTSSITTGISVEEWAQIDPEEARNIKAKFEIQAFEDEHKSLDQEEKIRMIRAEFEQFKEIKQNTDADQEEQDAALASPTSPDQEDLAAAAEHAQKMRAKWDKIQRKEAKKAEKAARVKEKITSPLALRVQKSGDSCWSCQKRVYIAEAVECDSKLYHKICFKCKQCGSSLRLETCYTGPDGIYCKVHYRALLNNVSRRPSLKLPAAIVAQLPDHEKSHTAILQKDQEPDRQTELFQPNSADSTGHECNLKLESDYNILQRVDDENGSSKSGQDFPPSEPCSNGTLIHNDDYDHDSSAKKDDFKPTTLVYVLEETASL